MSLWGTLSEPWRVCLSLAWESYCQGSLPIAAVIVDDENRVVAQGRNRLQDNDGAANALHRHPLAHAEVNALLDFSFARLDPKRCTLLTTTEPCPLCVGAVVMSNMRSLVYASRDPWAGCSVIFDTVPYPKSKGTCVGSLAGSAFESCLVALQVEAHLRGVRSGGVANESRFFTVWREVLPIGVAAGERLFAMGSLPELMRAHADARQLTELLESAVLEVA